MVTSEPFSAGRISVGMKRLMILGLLVASGCFRPVPTDNTPCPCGTGFECCAATQMCAATGTCEGGGGGAGGGAGGAGGGGGGTGDVVSIEPVPLTTDGVAPSAWLLRGLMEPAELRLVGETAYVLGRPGSTCTAYRENSYVVSVSRFEFIAGAWRLSWTTRLPVEPSTVVSKVTMIATASGVTVAGSGQVDGQAPRGGREAFVLRVNPDGSVPWVRRFATLFDEGATMLLARPNGKVLAAGTTGGGIEGNVSQGSDDVFLAMLRDDGTVEWVRQFGSSGFESPFNLIALDGEDFVVAGSTSGELEPGATVTSNSFFIRKYDGSGSAAWTKQHAFAGDSVAIRWASGFAVADLARMSVNARLDSAGNLEWSQLSTPRTFGGLGQLQAIDDDRAVVHALQTLDAQGPGTYPTRELVEQVWSSDGGVTNTAGLGGGWPRQNRALWEPVINHRADGAWFVAGSGKTDDHLNNIFSMSVYAPVGGVRLAHSDWFFSGPEFGAVTSSLDNYSIAVPLSLEFTPANAVVLLSRIVWSDCPESAGWLSLTSTQP